MGTSLSRISLFLCALFFAMACSTPILEESAGLVSGGETGELKEGLAAPTIPSSTLRKFSATPRMIFWSVGQGDFITYVSSQKCMAFDVGGSIALPAPMLLFLRSHCPRREISLFVSHFDKDHIRNFSKLAVFLRITDAYFSHFHPATLLGKKLLQALQFQSTRLHLVRAGWSETSAPQFAGLKTSPERPWRLDCLWPPPGPAIEKSKAENERSLVFKLTTPTRGFILTGDFPAKLEKKISLDKLSTANGTAVPLALKVGHHGSRSSSSELFLREIHAYECVISVGANNSYGHPHIQALNRMTENHCTILRTDVLGSIAYEL